MGLFDLGISWTANTLINQISDLYRLAKFCVFFADYLGILALIYFALKGYEIYLIKQIYNRGKDK